MTTSVTTDSRITFANGLVGQPDWKNFILVAAEDGPVQLLQSIEHAELALMVTDPFQIVPEYDLELSDADCAALDLGPNERPALLCTLSVHQEQITSNLVGPLVINTRTGSARQVVLLDSPYSTRYPVAPVRGDS
jgi:flagellar assembly factor FliW